MCIKLVSVSMVVDVVAEVVETVVGATLAQPTLKSKRKTRAMRVEKDRVVEAIVVEGTEEDSDVAATAADY